MFWFSWWPFHKKSSLSVYHPGEMKIYHYYDGKRWIHTDPMPLYKKVMEVGPELSIDLKVSQSPLKDAASAHTEALRKIRDIFKIKPFREGGLTDGASLDLFDHFMMYADEQKKNSSPLPTSSPPDSATPSSPKAAPTTPVTSDSGSTASASATDKPGPSPSAQA